jgi:hypothetical protein
VSPAITRRKGQTSYITTWHVAYCVDCAWRGRPLERATGPRATVSKPEAIRNIQAARHARTFCHKVLVEIHREFDRRTPVGP